MRVGQFMPSKDSINPILQYARFFSEHRDNLFFELLSRRYHVIAKKPQNELRKFHALIRDQIPNWFRLCIENLPLLCNSALGGR